MELKMKTQYFDAFRDALREAERLRQIDFYRAEACHYIVTRAENAYAVDVFSWAARDAALESNNLLIVI
jgi:hypothetical protein